MFGPGVTAISSAAPTKMANWGVEFMVAVRRKCVCGLNDAVVQNPPTQPQAGCMRQMRGDLGKLSS